MCGIAGVVHFDGRSADRGMVERMTHALAHRGPDGTGIWMEGGAGLGEHGHRADLVILKAARANAAFNGRRQISREDIRIAFELAIPHRMKRGPFADAKIDMSNLESQMQQLVSEMGEGDADGEPQSATEQQADDGKKKASR